MTAHIGSSHVVVDYPYSLSTTRTVESDIMARHLLTLAMNMQGTIDDDGSFAINIPAMNYSVTISELTKSLRALDENSDYNAIKFLQVESTGTRVYFRRL